MKKQTSKLKGFLQLAIMFLVLGFYSAAHAVPIHLNVSEDGNKLEITTPGNCTTGTNNNGCIKANGRTPVIYQIVGNKICSGSEKWALSKVAIRMDEDGGDGSGLTADVDIDFNVDMASGKLVDENGGSGNFKTRNYNSKTFTVWYRVYATCGGNKINSDPRMINNGTGSVP